MNNQDTNSNIYKIDPTNNEALADMLTELFIRFGMFEETAAETTHTPGMVLVINPISEEYVFTFTGTAEDIHVLNEIFRFIGISEQYTAVPVEVEESKFYLNDLTHPFL